MLAPLGAPASRLNVSVLAGTSASVAEAVNVSRLPSFTDLFPSEASSGATFTSPTVTSIVSKSSRLGVPLSVTRTVMLYVPGP